MQKSAPFVSGIVIMVLGAACIVVGLPGVGADNGSLISGGIGVALLLIGISLAFHRTIIEQATIGRDQISFVFAREPAEEAPAKVLSPETEARRKRYVEENPPPAADAPAFNALTDAPDLAAVPGADSMVPMYMLDRNFRILDWNEAFSLAFNNTMEGRRGQGAIEWVYFLDNFQEVLDHGIEVFSDPANLPLMDKEELKYTNVRYGELTATKRAYQFPDDTGACAGWLVILDVKFRDPREEERYRSDLTRTLWRTLLWTEYSLSYDQVLTNSSMYQRLVTRILGEDGKLEKIPDNARVLDLGAGTGNIASRLARDGKTVFALDNNRTMLNILRGKCREAPLRRDDAGPGVIAIKQDINSLFGLPSQYFDVAIANHVLYSLRDPIPCLKDVARVLKPNGEVRISGPSKGFSLRKVFRSIKSDLVSSGKFSQLERHYEQARRINNFLEGDLRGWSERNLEELLREARFPVVTHDVPYYRGNGRIICACKRP